LGMAEEFKRQGSSINSLWPKTTIATSAIETFFPDAFLRSRKDSIVSDAAYIILTKEPAPTGHFFIDEEVLRDEGMTDFEKYAMTPGEKLQTDLFL